VEKHFLSYHWPGNVRELEHTIESAMNLVSDSDITLEPDHFASTLFADMISGACSIENTHLSSNKIVSHKSINDEEIKKLTDALDKADGVAANAAKLLNISPQLFNYRLKKNGLKRKHIIIHDPSKNLR
jgi:arginine utilization regulatory protein